MAVRNPMLSSTVAGETHVLRVSAARCPIRNGRQPSKAHDARDRRQYDYPPSIREQDPAQASHQYRSVRVSEFRSSAWYVMTAARSTATKLFNRQQPSLLRRLNIQNDAQPRAGSTPQRIKSNLGRLMNQVYTGCHHQHRRDADQNRKTTTQQDEDPDNRQQHQTQRKPAEAGFSNPSRQITQLSCQHQVCRRVVVDAVRKCLK